MCKTIQLKTISLFKNIKWYQPILILLIFAAPYLAFHNLETNPRPWQDEGAYLSVAKAVAEDGVYAVKTSDGYQTFGPIQSVGPTVIVPIAIGYKLFGVGLLQGRIIIVIMSLITSILFYLAGKELFGSASSTLAVLLLLGSPAAEYLLVSRQVIGENVALGFFLGGWLLMSKGLSSQNYARFVLSGLLFGASMVTKAQFAPMIFGALLLLLVLDFLYYRQGSSKILIIIGVVALGCVIGWWAWQYYYFGAELFQQNAEKLRQLSLGTGGFDLGNTVDAIRFLIGTGSGHYYYFLGFPGLFYVGSLCWKRNYEGFSLAFLVLFCTFWITYYLFWTNPWLLTVYAPMAISAIFVGKLLFDLISGFIRSCQKYGSDLFKSFLKGESSQDQLMAIGTFLTIVILAGFTFYDIQRAIRVYVIDRVGIDRTVVRTPPQLEVPRQVADYLNKNVSKDEIIETWERELGILTELTYHYPDQSLLGDTYGAIYRNQPRKHVLGEEYFQTNRPSYLVIGWFARSNNLYDLEYVNDHSVLVVTFGSGDWRFDVYKTDF